jgi:hypothetical protein
MRAAARHIYREQLFFIVYGCCLERLPGQT